MAWIEKIKNFKHKKNVGIVISGFILYFWCMWQLDVLMIAAWREGAWFEDHAIWYFIHATKGLSYDVLMVLNFIGIVAITVGLWLWDVEPTGTQP